MKKKLNPNWQNQRDITGDMFCIKNKQNEAYLNHLANVHELPMQELIDACKLMVIWVPYMREVDFINQ